MSSAIATEQSLASRGGPARFISKRDLLANAALRYGDASDWGASIRHRIEVGYFSPAEHYETLVDKLVTPTTTWLDVGCGHELFPGNPALATGLAARCERLVGIDPDPSVRSNTWVHEQIQGPIEQYRPDEQFDLVTLRMVAEHIVDPKATAAALCRLVREGGRVVIFTPSKWAATSVAARLTPTKLHHLIKARIWNTEERDTFPVSYRMNTRRDLRQLMHEAGLREASCQRLPDASLFWRWRRVHRIELAVWSIASRHVPSIHPDACLLGVYERIA